MPLPVPVLDDRSYEQLRAELVRRIGAYTPEWTDHGPGDPGITLLELVAFLGENLLFRFNQIPEATRLWMLRLLQVPLHPAQPARGLLALRTEDDTAAPSVPAGTGALAGPVRFETQSDTRVLPVDVRGVIKRPQDPADEEGRQLVEAAIDALGGLADGERAVTYVAEVLGPDPLLPAFEPLDVSVAVDHTLWVAVLAQSEAARDALMGHGGLLGQDGGAVLSLGVAVPPEPPGLDDLRPCAGAQAPLRRPCEGPRAPLPDASAAAPQMRWSVSSTVEDDDGTARYLPVAIDGDTTEGLTRDGVVRLRLPADLSEVGVLAVEDALAGTGDLPPVLDEEGALVLFWLRVQPPPGVPEIGRVRWLGANAVMAEQSSSLRSAELVGTGDGMPNQAFALANRGVLPGTLDLQVEEDGTWVRWEAVDGMVAADHDSRVYVLDPEAGTVRFGDTVRGRAPQPGERIRARAYRFGGGAAGNVGPGAVSEMDSGADRVTVTNPLEIRGGADPESVESGLERIPGELRRRSRAVTRDDFRELALQTPGGGVGRAECLPRFHPPSRTLEVPGVVTVVAWPAADPRHPAAPMPDRALLRQVCAWLDTHRLVTTELYVVAPVYRQVAVSVGVEAKQGYSPEAVRRWVELVLRQYLAALPPYGPAGQGWPLGHRVHGPELEAAALQVEGVDYLTGLRVSGRAPGGGWTEGTVLLEPWELPELVRVSVVVAAGPPDPGAEPPPPPVEGTPLPLPVPSRSC